MLRINASEVALTTGYHIYGTNVKYVDLFMKNLYTNNDKLKERDNVEYLNSSQYTNSVLSSNDKKVLVDECLKSDITDTTILNDKINEVSTLVDSLDDPYKEIIKANLVDRLNRNYGHATEAKAIKLYEAKTDNTVYDNNTTYYHKKFDSFIICGRIDGLVNKDGKIYINEVKNRRNRLFDSIPLYEIVQLLVYTKIVGINDIIFTQCKDDDCKIDTFDDFVNVELWEDILNRLNIYCSLIYQFRKMHTLRKEFLLLTSEAKYQYLATRLHWL